MRIFSILVEVIKGNGTFSIHLFVHSTIFVKTHYVPGGIHGTGDKKQDKNKIPDFRNLTLWRRQSK